MFTITEDDNVYALSFDMGQQIHCPLMKDTYEKVEDCIVEVSELGIVSECKAVAITSTNPLRQGVYYIGPKVWDELTGKTE